MAEFINIINKDFNFNNNNNKIRVLGTSTDPWFVAKDICIILGLSNVTNALKYIPEKWIKKEIIKSSCGEQLTIIISQSAVYKLIMQLRKPISEKFIDCICEEILPKLIDTGYYEIKKDEIKNENLYYLYIISNEDFKNSFKIGISDNIIKTLDDLEECAPEPYDIRYLIKIYSKKISISIKCLILGIFNEYRTEIEGKKTDWLINIKIHTIEKELNLLINMYNEKKYNIEKLTEIDKENIKENIKEIIISPIHKFRYIKKQNDIWFVAKDICDILGLSNITNALRNIPEKWIKKEIIKSTYNSQNMNVINITGLKKLLQSTRSKNTDLITKSLSILNINFDIIFTCKEASCLNIICKSFENFSQKLQYQVNKYRIDLYFPEYKLAIEVDELNHENRNTLYENERQTYLEKNLGCEFIRFNPDEKNFNIGNVIKKILIKISEYKDS